MPSLRHQDQSPAPEQACLADRLVEIRTRAFDPGGVQTTPMLVAGMALGLFAIDPPRIPKNEPAIDARSEPKCFRRVARDSLKNYQYVSRAWGDERSRTRYSVFKAFPAMPAGHQGGPTTDLKEYSS